MAYFPIFEPYDIEEYGEDWPVLETPFEKPYRQTLSLGFKIRVWKGKWLLLNTYDTFATTWRRLTVYTIGQYVRPTTANSRVYMCVAAAGSSGASEPSWTTTFEGSVTDSGITWICLYDNPITTFLTFFDNRKGRAESFYLYMPLLATWVNVQFPLGGVKMNTVQAGYYFALETEVLFEEKL